MDHNDVLVAISGKVEGKRRCIWVVIVKIDLLATGSRTLHPATRSQPAQVLPSCLGHLLVSGRL
jgi:hypothetical protein